MSEKTHTAGKNGKFGSRLGFILASVGSAVGMGNIWMFPYRVGQYGGAAFYSFISDLSFYSVW